MPGTWPTWLQTLLSLIGVATALGVIAAAVWSSYSHRLAAAQARVVEAQAEEIRILDRKVVRLEGELREAEVLREQTAALATAQHDADVSRLESLGREIDTLREVLSGRADMERLTVLITQHDADTRTGREQLRVEMQGAVQRVHEDLTALATQLGKMMGGSA